MKNHREKMSVCVSVCMFKIMCTLIKVGIHAYMTYSTGLRCGSFPEKFFKKKHLFHDDKNYCYFCK